jgi:threonine/homoserine/homoserine lactone efflux protein
MEINSYLIFLSIAFAYIISPGPAVFIAINYGAIFGLQKTIYLLFGNTLGLGILAFISATGIGSLIINIPILDTVFRICGSFALIYIGLKMIINSKFIIIKQSIDNTIEDRAKFDFFKEGLMLSLSNPKPIIFFMSFYPQFINFKENQLMQFLILGFTFMLISFVSLNIYSLSSKFAFGKFLTQKRAIVFNLSSGILLVCMALLLMMQIAIA